MSGGPYREVKAHITRRLESIGRDLVEAARDRLSTGGGSADPGHAPHTQSGELAGSVGFAVEDLGGTLTLWVGTDVEHGFYQEVGTGEVEPRPWLMPTVEESRGKILGGFK